ncbi:MAG: hypothetical protein PVG99_12280, partial [Desulfobacteraceae bacterium]
MAVQYELNRLRECEYTLGLLCSQFVDQFGQRAAEMISFMCHQRGLSLGKALVSRVSERNFVNAIKAFVAASEKTASPAKLISLKEKRAVLQGNVCPLGLEGRGRDVCQAVMTMDQGILEEISG